MDLGDDYEEADEPGQVEETWDDDPITEYLAGGEEQEEVENEGQGDEEIEYTDDT